MLTPDQITKECFSNHRWQDIAKRYLAFYGQDGLFQAAKFLLGSNASRLSVRTFKESMYQQYHRMYEKKVAKAKVFFIEHPQEVSRFLHNTLDKETAEFLTIKAWEQGLTWHYLRLIHDSTF